MLIRLIQLILFTFTLAQSAQAAMITESGGFMTGATGINVGGKLYDMELKDGTCALLFGGCDEQSDFPFDAAGTQEALTELLDLITVSMFVNAPDKITGCAASIYQSCVIETPYNVFDAFNIQLDELVIFSYADPLITQGVFLPPSFDTSSASHVVYALWTAQPTRTIPEPSSLLLIGMGLLGQRLVSARSKRLPV